MLYTTIIDGVTFYSQEYLEWKERHAWWRGFIISIVWAAPIHALIIWVGHR
mgnify:CR=1 FL=1